MCLLIGTGSQVSDVAYGPLVVIVIGNLSWISSPESLSQPSLSK